jgi:hypothetical protein
VKRISVGWLSGSWTQKCWDRFGWWPLRLGHFDWRPPWLGKAGCAPENLSQESRVVGDYSLRRLHRLFMDSLGWPAERQSTSVTRGWLRSAVCRHKCLPSCRTKGFPASSNFESKLSVSALVWSAKNGFPKSSWICLLLTYQGALVAMRRRLDCKTFSFRTWLRAADLQIGNA